jgi:hypothetical protein
VNQGRHPGREAARRTLQQTQARYPALVHFFHQRILPRILRKQLVDGTLTPPVETTQ